MDSSSLQTCVTANKLVVHCVLKFCWSKGKFPVLWVSFNLQFTCLTTLSQYMTVFHQKDTVLWNLRYSKENVDTHQRFGLTWAVKWHAAACSQHI